MRLELGTAVAGRRMERKLVAILAADVVGYSRLMGADEEGTLAVLKAHRRDLIDPKIAEHHGRTVKLTGDGALVEFGSLVDAMRCAVEIQNGMVRRNADVPADRRIAFRIGINLGDVIVDGDDIYGEGVNVAARLEGLAEPGGICISGTSHEMIQGRLDVPFRDLGAHEVKNIARPVRVWAWGEVAVPADAAGPQPRTDKPSIAVLPFSNISGDVEQEYFVDGITEDIITDLSKVSGLFVAARNSAFTYKGTPAKVQQVSRDLGVRYVLEGSVRKAANRVRITAQLIDGASGGHLWAERYDRDLTDIFVVQDDIAHSIVDELKVKLLPSESKNISKIPTENIEAYHFYLRGRQILNRHTMKFYETARKMFTRAIEIDPSYARAYAGVTDCDANRLLFGADVSIQSLLDTSARALALDPDLAEARTSRAFALAMDGQHDEAEQEFQAALRLAPNLFETHFLYGRASCLREEYEQAASHFERAAEVAPDDIGSLLMLGMVYRTLGRASNAAAAHRNCMARIERALERSPEDANATCSGAIVLVSLGELERAREWAGRALWLDPDDPVVSYNAACAYARLGERDTALDLLERVVPGHRHRVQWARKDSDLESLRDEPRFQALLASS
jgi:adenylate cyclase